MPPRDFSEDGAIGAGTQAGSTIGGIQMNDPGPGGADDAWGKGSKNYNDAWGTPDGTPDLSYTAYGLQDGSGNYYDTTTGVKMTKTAGGWTDPTRGADLQRRTAAQTASRAHGVDPYAGETPFVYARGGAIEDTDPTGDSNGSPGQDAVSKALNTLDGILAFGYKLHGLGGGDNEGIPGAQAAAMPTRPAGQSETGIPPQQPGPGTLPPTNNPFGKRADDDSQDSPMQTAGLYPMPTRPAGQSETGIPPMQPGPGTLPPTSNPFGKRADNDSDDGGQAIDTEEESA